MMPLLFADKGESCIIKKVGGSAETKKHIENLGFVAGAEITIITENGGNLIVNVKESRVAISREMAEKIFV
jgi:ferrous iron transport protein A